MTDHDSLLAAVLENPADDTARLVLADGLHDSDDPDARVRMVRPCVGPAQGLRPLLTPGRGFPGTSQSCHLPQGAARREEQFVTPADPGTHAREGVPPLRVLCVDDNRDVADSTADLLRLTGFDARACYRGADALTQ